MPRALARTLDRLARGRRAIRDRGAIPKILAELVSTGTAEADWAVTSAHPPRWSPSGVTVVLIGPRAGKPRLAVKISHDDAGHASLVRERDVEVALHADPRLVSWRGLVPEPIAEGRATGLGYVVERAIAGQPAMASMADTSARAAFTSAAGAAIRELHLLTAERIRVDDDALARWVDAPLRAVAGIQDANGDAARRSADIQSLRDRLRASLLGREVTTARIHGDYWPGNILLWPDRSALAGIIDWDRSAAAELPWHDVLHLLLFTRQMLGLPGLTRILAEPDAQNLWTPTEEDLLARTRDVLADDSPHVEILALLYWLRQAAATLAVNPRLGQDRRYAAMIGSVLRLSTSVAGGR
jgi:aminoglycoside phosphotransferase (APT) family kinase protein